MVRATDPGDLFERLDVGIVFIDTGSNEIMRVNQAAVRMAGLPAAQLVGQQWAGLAPDGRESEMRGLLAARLSGERTDTHITSTYTRPDGKVLNLLVTSSLAPDVDGGPPVLVCLFQDITGQLLAQEHLRLVVDNTPVSIHLVDRSGRLLFSSGVLASAEKVLARASTSSVMDAFEDFPEGLELLYRALAGERTFQVVEAFGRYFDVHTVPVPGPNGIVAAAAVVATEVTERERVRLELSTRAREQEAVVELSRLALDLPDPAPLLERAVQILTDQLDAAAVTVHEHVRRHRKPAENAMVAATATATAAGAGTPSGAGGGDPAAGRELRLIAYRGTPPSSTHLGDRALAAGAAVTADGVPGPRPAGGDDSGRARWSAVAIPLGPREHPWGVITAYRGCGDPARRRTYALPAPAARAGDGPFNEREITFITSVAGVLGAADARIQAEGDIRHRALHDALTGLPNRAFLLDGVAQASAVAQARGEHIGVLLIDLDDFKSINDSFGHQTGDELLQKVAARLRGAVRPGDTVARLYGDEFAVLCENITSHETLGGIAARVVGDVAQPIHIAGRALVVGVSVGAVLSTADLFDVDGLMRAADLAMYAAKQRGRGRYLVFDKHLHPDPHDVHIDA